MRYMGGKSKIRKQIAAFLESVRKPGQTYFEPFVGGAWVLQEMTGRRIAGDGNDALISLYKALQEGWTPPDSVSREEWEKFRGSSRPVKDPMQAFARFGCGFGGSWEGGYAEPEGRFRNYALQSKASLLRQLPLIKDVEFVYGSYDEHDPEGMLVYCDPPYGGKRAYSAVSGFDHDAFWDKMREWSKKNTVVISEYDAPDDFEAVLSVHSRMGLRTGRDGDLQMSQDKREEKLFMLKAEGCRNKGIEGHTGDGRMCGGFMVVEPADERAAEKTSEVFIREIDGLVSERAGRRDGAGAVKDLHNAIHALRIGVIYAEDARASVNAGSRIGLLASGCVDADIRIMKKGVEDLKGILRIMSDGMAEDKHESR